MTEHDHEFAGTATPDEVRTGVADVDAVLESVAALEDRPVEEHAGVFEAAHEQLRRSLDGSALTCRAAAAAPGRRAGPAGSGPLPRARR